MPLKVMQISPAGIILGYIGRVKGKGITDIGVLRAVIAAQLPAERNLFLFPLLSGIVVRKVEQILQIIDEEALDYLMNEGTRDMDFDYNFGDVIELCYEDAFTERLSRRGLSLVSTPVIDINVFEHDDVIVTRDEVLGR